MNKRLAFSKDKLTKKEYKSMNSNKYVQEGVNKAKEGVKLFLEGMKTQVEGWPWYKKEEWLDIDKRRMSISFYFLTYLMQNEIYNPGVNDEDISYICTFTFDKKGKFTFTDNIMETDGFQKVLYLYLKLIDALDECKAYMDKYNLLNKGNRK